jgi:hypothetical protein
MIVLFGRLRQRAHTDDGRVRRSFSYVVITRRNTYPGVHPDVFISIAVRVKSFPGTYRLCVRAQFTYLLFGSTSNNNYHKTYTGTGEKKRDAVARPPDRKSDPRKINQPKATVPVVHHYYLLKYDFKRYLNARV